MSRKSVLESILEMHDEGNDIENINCINSSNQYDNDNIDFLKKKNSKKHSDIDALSHKQKEYDNDNNDIINRIYRNKAVQRNNNNNNGTNSIRRNRYSRFNNKKEDSFNINKDDDNESTFNKVNSSIDDFNKRKKIDIVINNDLINTIMNESNSHLPDLKNSDNININKNSNNFYAYFNQNTNDIYDNINPNDRNYKEMKNVEDIHNIIEEKVASSLNTANNNYTKETKHDDKGMNNDDYEINNYTIIPNYLKPDINRSIKLTLKFKFLEYSMDNNILTLESENLEDIDNFFSKEEINSISPSLVYNYILDYYLYRKENCDRDDNNNDITINFDINKKTFREEIFSEINRNDKTRLNDILNHRFNNESLNVNTNYNNIPKRENKRITDFKQRNTNDYQNDNNNNDIESNNFLHLNSDNDYDTENSNFDNYEESDYIKGNNGGKEHVTFNDYLFKSKSLENSKEILNKYFIIKLISNNYVPLELLQQADLNKINLKKNYFKRISEDEYIFDIIVDFKMYLLKEETECLRVNMNEAASIIDYSNRSRYFLEMVENSNINRSVNLNTYAPFTKMIIDNEVLTDKKLENKDFIKKNPEFYDLFKPFTKLY